MEPATVTSLSELRQAPAPREANLPAVRMGYESLQGFELMQRAAKAFASSSLVPQQYQGNMPNCMIALEMANRMGASPLMVVQNLHIVHGRPGWSAQFLIATFNNNGKYSALRYEFFGEKGKDTWGCRAWAIEKATGEKLVGADVTVALAKLEGWYEKNGSKWKTMPQQMLMYRAASWFIRSYAPEIAMGLHTADELGDTFDATLTPDGSFTVDGLKDVTGTAAPAAQEPQAEPAKVEQPAAKTKKKHESAAPTITDALALVNASQYDDATALVAGTGFTDLDRQEIAAAVKRHQGGEKV